MLIYYIMFLFLLIGYYLCEIKKSDENIIIFLILSGIIFIGVSTLRYSIGYDYFSYESIFKTISKMNFSEINTLYKDTFIGYAYINKIVELLNGNYIILLLVCNTFMTITVIWFIYNYSCMPWISIFLYITFQFFAHSMNIFRQSIAVSIFLLSYPFIRDRKFIPYLILILILSSIHISGLILILLYFIINMNTSLKSMLIIIIPALIVYIFDEQLLTVLINYIHPSFARYKDSFYWRGNGISYIILPTFYFICTIIFKNKLIAKNKKNEILINTSLYNFIIYFFITKHFILERFSIYVFIFSIILIPEILSTLKTKFSKKCGLYITIMIGVFYFLFAVNEGFHNVYPYISIFKKP